VIVAFGVKALSTREAVLVSFLLNREAIAELAEAI